MCVAAPMLIMCCNKNVYNLGVNFKIIQAKVLVFTS